jgi:hypothetical protein
LWEDATGSGEFNLDIGTYKLKLLYKSGGALQLDYIKFFSSVDAEAQTWGYIKRLYE